MPKKATNDKEEIIEKKKSTVKKTSSTGATTAKKNSRASKEAPKTEKKTATAQKGTVASKTSKSSKTATATKKSGTTTKKSTTTKKATTQKTESKSTKSSTAKKTTAKNTTTKKATPKSQIPAKETVPKELALQTASKKTLAKKEEKIKEETVIQKIKAFIAKIIAMQEEARLEAENKKAEKADKKQETKKSEVQTPYMLEYYDLPYRYNETVVKILAQTPKRLFVYWDISDKDRQKYILAFGEKFFEETYPVLLVHNDDMNYTFEVPINDFANSWYLDIKDPKTKYTIQLGRKFRNKPEKVNIVASTETESVVLNNDYVPIITSNALEVPNDHILFENIQSKVIYRNVKTGKETTVEIDNLEFAKKMGHVYSIYDIYKEIYENEMDSDSLTNLLNPSSMSSSVFR